MRLDRAPSTICREIKRNSGPDGYRASHADQLAWDRARRPKACKLVEHRTLAHMVAGKLQLQWSPQQIAGWLRRAYPDNEDYHVSHETIYRSLFIQARGALKKELLEHLRRTRAMRLRANGYAALAGLSVPGINAVAAPVYDHTGKVSVVIGLLGRDNDLPVSGESAHINSLLDCAALASERLGYDAGAISRQAEET
jgi:hypothetical protein